LILYYLEWGLFNILVVVQFLRIRN
jgi:hypothetical protein